MKAFVNNLLSRFSLEIHGTGYIKKLKKSGAERDAFLTQTAHCRNAKVIFDVGANRGGVTKQYREIFSEATIHAFEPLSDFQEAFYKEHSKDNKVVYNNCALSDSITTTEFYINRNADTSSMLKSVTIGATSDSLCETIKIVKVPTNMIDSYCLNNNIREIDILKMDAQGAELLILKGATELLKRQKIKLIYTEAFFQEQYEAQPLLYDLANFLREYGYCLEDIYNPYFNDTHILWCDAIFLPK